MLKKSLLFTFICLNSVFICAQGSGLNYYKIISDTLFDSNQRAFILAIQKEKIDEFKIDIVHSDDLKRTSEFGDHNLALAAINGGFFNMKKGFSVSYLERWDRMISPSSSENAMLNGALVVEKEGDIVLEKARPDSIYEISKEEESVLVSGPLLLQKGEKVEVKETKFSTNRHPRSCICESEKEILFIVVDGRSDLANGMNIEELQHFLLNLKCVDALNLDGGGSSALWIRGKGVVNAPSDKTGERPVANAIVIKPK